MTFGPCPLRRHLSIILLGMKGIAITRECRLRIYAAAPQVGDAPPPVYVPANLVHCRSDVLLLPGGRKALPFVEDQLLVASAAGTASLPGLGMGVMDSASRRYSLIS